VRGRVKRFAEFAFNFRLICATPTLWKLEKVWGR